MTEQLPGNPHYPNARAAGKYFEFRTINSDAEVIAMAGVEAALAIAFEQRTANMIAYAAHNPDVLVEGLDEGTRSRLGISPAAATAGEPDRIVQREGRCSKPLLGSRNEYRCWGPAGHDGPCR